MESEVIHIINLRVPQWTPGTSPDDPGTERIYCVDEYCVVDYVE